MNIENPVSSPGLPIASVERETGLSKDVLRMWERRYGFPEPMRDENGERRYSGPEVTKLRAIRRLMDTGIWPGTIVHCAIEGRDRLGDRARRAPGPADGAGNRKRNARLAATA